MTVRTTKQIAADVAGRMVKEEREACAALAEREAAGKSCHCPFIGRDIARRIRARGSKSARTEQ